MIRSYRSGDAAELYTGLVVSKRLRPFAKQALRKIQLLDSATNLGDLSIPGNHVEKLSKDRKGQYSIRINEQWRLCFRWEDRDAYDVEIADYH